MCSSPKLFAAYHVLHRLIVPRHPSCALSSLTTKKTFAPGTLPHSGLSLLLFLSTKKLFLFLQILFQDTFFDCQSTPRSPAALPLLPQRKSFLIKSVCRIGGFVGESFSPTPPFPLCAGLSFPVGCALSVRGGGSAALLVRLRRPTPHHPLRGCAGGASLCCVHLRHFRSSLPASATAEPCSPFTSAPRRIPRFFTGRQSRANHHKYMVGVLGFEPRTSSLSGTRSTQLSYTPILDYRSFSTAESLMVESKGLEPSTSCLQSRCSSH